MAVSFCVFVGIHFHRQCVQKINVSEGKCEEGIPNARVGYSGLFIDAHQPSGNAMYLEPVSSYDVEINQEVIHDSSSSNVSDVNENTNEKTSYSPCIIPQSRRTVYPSKENENMIGYSKKILFPTSSV